MRGDHPKRKQMVMFEYYIQSVQKFTELHAARYGAGAIVISLLYKNKMQEQTNFQWVTTLITNASIKYNFFLVIIVN